MLLQYFFAKVIEIFETTKYLGVFLQGLHSLQTLQLCKCFGVLFGDSNVFLYFCRKIKQNKNGKESWTHCV